ncbi:MAG: iron transporter [Bacteroidetes bacterium]|nr:iron transporter [Bacteroidota bacterium]
MHQEEHFRSSDLVRDIVIGMADGLTVPFALAAGLSGAVDSTHIIITAGIAEIAAGSIAMGLGGYLSGRTEMEHYKSEEAREYYEVEHFPEKERAEVKEIFAGYGIAEDVQDKIVDELSKDKKQYVDFMMRYELGLEPPSVNRARNSALTIGISYVVGGLIPLLPYVFLANVHTGLLVSVIVTLLALFIFGYIKSRVTGQSPFKGAVNTMIIGALAAGAAFLIASLFQKG